MFLGCLVPLILLAILTLGRSPGAAWVLCICLVASMLGVVAIVLLAVRVLQLVGLS